nr:ABC transporter substrate-binding protein [Zoogloeaceae bacterium]
ADIYIRVTGAKIDRGFLLQILENPEIRFTVAPRNTFALAEFIHRVGAIKNKPASWKDYFFDDAITATGS